MGQEFKEYIELWLCMDKMIRPIIAMLLPACHDYHHVLLRRVRVGLR